MFYSKLYKKYYPLHDLQDIKNMELCDRRELADLVLGFGKKIETKTFRLVRKGYGNLGINTMGDLSFGLLKEKLRAGEPLSDKETRVVIEFLNAVLRENKYRKIICVRKNS